MKFIVNELPYYKNYCPLEPTCPDGSSEECPRQWSKYKVCSNENSHECYFLREQSRKEPF